MKSPHPLLSALLALGFAGAAVAALPPTVDSLTAVPKSKQDKDANGASLEGRAAVTAQVTSNGLKTMVTIYFDKNPITTTAPNPSPSVGPFTIQAGIPAQTFNLLIPTASQVSSTGKLEHGALYNVRAIATNSDGSASKNINFVENVSPKAKPIKAHVPAGETQITIPVTTPASAEARPYATDPDDDALKVSVPPITTHGTAAATADQSGIIYTPNPANFATGEDSFSYTVADPFGATATATVSIVNNAPNAVDDSFAVPRNSQILLNVLANDTDEDKPQLRITAIPAKIEGGTLRLVGKQGHQQILFTPDGSFDGLTQFKYTVTDFYGKTATALVDLLSAQALITRSIGIALKDASGKIAGYLRIESLPNGAFTARIEVGAKKYRLIGSFDASGRFTGVAHDEDGGFLPLTVGVGLDANGAATISANLGAGQYTSEQALATIGAGALADLEGRYTVELPPGSGTTTTTGDTTTTTTDGSTTTTVSGPEGTGWMTIKVDENGDASMKGKTGDGRSFSARGVVGGSDDAPDLTIFATPHSGTLAGTLKFGETISGSLQWTRGQTDADFYPDGFDLPLSATGGRYERPDDGRRVLATDTTDAGRGTLTVSGGNVDGFTRQLRFSEDDKVEVLDKGLEDSGLKIRRKDGTFSGGFSDPDDDGHHIKFTGVLIQSTGGGSGVFQGRDKAGTVKLSITTSVTTTP
jgi:hypothetical protein